ncbi:ABC transporter permease [Alteromonas sp. 14N.309.X.WAT.G.H12]|uniref:ABC transporter permease n=1 Tax=Alteromonas sp. 14N.309.X.WAT.G.H12 TaxID=3120824 RepID=UPI002FD5A9E7
MRLTLAIESLKHRRGAVLLTLMSIVISVSLLLSVEHIRGQVKESFTRTVSGTDLIVGGRTGQLNLLLYSVFHIGESTSPIDWKDVQTITSHPQVAWSIPLVLGDSHKGYRVVGTSNAYFEHFQYGNKQHLKLAHGHTFQSDDDAVLGFDVAEALGYHVGDEIIISHGLGAVSFQHHSNHPFIVSGILAPTGTPVDRAIQVTMHGLDAAHDHSHGKHEHEGSEHPHHDNDVHEEDGEHHIAMEHDHDDEHHRLSTEPPSQVSAVLLGLKNRVAVLQIQHQVNQFKEAPLMAILPGVALTQLWQLMGNVEKLLLAISVLILVSSLVGLITLLLVTLRERQKEMAVLRAIGAGPFTVLLLIQTEALLISLLACLISIGLVSAIIAMTADWMSSEYGLFLSADIFTGSTAIVIMLVLAATWLASLVPAIKAYRQALHSGLSG